MAKGRKKSGLLFLFTLGVFTALIVLLLSIRIPCTRAALLVINEKSGGFPRDINLTIEKISIDLKGTLHLHGIRVGKPQVSRINYMSVNYSFTRFFKGNLDVSSMSIDSLYLATSELLPFAEELERTGALDKDPLESLNFGGALVSINTTAIRSGESPEPARVNDAELDLTSGRGGSFYWQIKTDEVIKHGLPQINHTLMEGTYSPELISVERMNISTLSGDFLGNVVYQIPTRQIEGKVSFKNYNLKKLTRSGFFGKGNISGRVSGEVILNGDLKNLEALKSLANLKGTDISASNLPFQNDKAINNYMPALKNINFRTLSIPEISIDDDKIHIGNMKGIGDTLSIEGSGYVTLKGRLYFNLLCILNEDYYQTLYPIVKDGIITDEDDRRLFKCEIVGNLQHQEIKLNKVISQVVKSNFKKIGRGIKRLFQ